MKNNEFFEPLESDKDVSVFRPFEISVLASGIFFPVKSRRLKLLAK